MVTWFHDGVLGPKTCDLCRSLLGKFYEGEEPPYTLPLHKHCRCHWRKITEEDLVPFTYPGGVHDPHVTLEEFILDVFGDGDTVIASTELLYYFLSQKIVAEYWWDLSDVQRNNLAGTILGAYTRFDAANYAYGKDGHGDCDGIYYSWQAAHCEQDAIIKWAKIGDNLDWLAKMRNCYWRHWSIPHNSYVVFCYGEVSFGLPVYIVTVYGHCICALQIKENQDCFTSWRFFQYDNTNITPGNYQMPCGTGKSVKIVNLRKIDCGFYGKVYDDPYIVKWNFDADCNPVLDPAPTLVWFVVLPLVAKFVGGEVDGESPTSETLVYDREYSGSIYIKNSETGEYSILAIESFKLYVNSEGDLEGAYDALTTGVHYAFDCADLKWLFSVVSGYDGYLVVDQSCKKFTFVFTVYPE